MPQTFDEKVKIEAEKFKIEFRKSQLNRHPALQASDPPTIDAVLFGAAFAKKEFENKDGEVCPACATEWEKGTMKLCGGILVKEAVELRAEVKRLHDKYDLQLLVKQLKEKDAERLRYKALYEDYSCEVDELQHERENLRTENTRLVGLIHEASHALRSVKLDSVACDEDSV